MAIHLLELRFGDAEAEADAQTPDAQTLSIRTAAARLPSHEYQFERRAPSFVRAHSFANYRRPERLEPLYERRYSIGWRADADSS